MLDDILFKYDAQSDKQDDADLMKALKEQCRTMAKALEKLKQQMTDAETDISANKLKWSGFEDEYHKLAQGIATMASQVPPPPYHHHPTQNNHYIFLLAHHGTRHDSAAAPSD